MLGISFASGMNTYFKARPVLCNALVLGALLGDMVYTAMLGGSWRASAVIY